MNFLFVVIGAALIVFSCGAFWYLLPRNGRVHALVEKWDGGSMLTLVLMCTLTAGFGFLIEAFIA